MAKAKDITGLRFGRLVALRRSGHIESFVAWLCRCDCGQEKRLRSTVLLRGITLSCGCLRSEKSAERKLRHGMTRTPTYHAWASMNQRCTNQTDKSYKRYGGRGITVCDRWQSFENFLADMGKRPSSIHRRGVSLDRINNDGAYEPSNCRWATPREQANNTRRNRRLTADGQTKTIAQWARLLGVSAKLVKSRYRKGTLALPAV